MGVGVDVFRGCLPALMTPWRGDGGGVDFGVLVGTARRLVGLGMGGVVYCGSMGDWPLVSDGARREGVERLVGAGVRVVVGTGSVSPGGAAGLAAHARGVGAAGLMVIPRVLSRGGSVAAQRAHFAGVLGAGEGLPSVVYNSPCYGFSMGADMFFGLREEFPWLVGFKEFGGAAGLSRAGEFIACGEDGLVLVVGVDTQVVHGFLRCGAVGAITGVGNVLPVEVLHLVGLCGRAVRGDVGARRLALELGEALGVLAGFDEGPDLSLYYRFLMGLVGEGGYGVSVEGSDVLGVGQRRFAAGQLEMFRGWWDGWEGRGYGG